MGSFAVLSCLARTAGAVGPFVAGQRMHDPAAAAAEAAADAEADEAEREQEREADVDHADGPSPPAPAQVEQHQSDSPGSTWSMMSSTVGSAGWSGGGAGSSAGCRVPRMLVVPSSLRSPSFPPTNDATTILPSY